jgi:hypothetical protein
MKLIKVEHVKDERGHNLSWDTARNLFKEIFGEDSYGQPYHGVKFESVTGYSSFYGGVLKGIQMTAGRNSNAVRRRVMINKGGMIDADAVKAKFEELKIEVARQEARMKEINSHQELVKACLDRVMAATGAPDWYEYAHDHNGHLPPIDLASDTPTTVKMEAEVNGTQLVALEQIFGTLAVKVELVVPEEKAVQVYRIMNGETK